MHAGRRPIDQPHRGGLILNNNTADQQTPFDDLTDVYEALIDWPKRLANEEPFYRRWFGRVRATRVLDAACGVGRHAAMFHSWGLRVEGADLSPNMIARARAAFGEPPGLCWAVRSFDAPIDTAEPFAEKGDRSNLCAAPSGPFRQIGPVPFSRPFDAAVCVGNSLALAPDLATAGRAISQMLAAVREKGTVPICAQHPPGRSGKWGLSPFPAAGGIVIVHLQNLWRLLDGPCNWQKCIRHRLGTVPIFAAPAMLHCESAETPRKWDCPPHAAVRPSAENMDLSPSDDVLILKGVHRCGQRGFVDLAIVRVGQEKATAPLLHSESVPLLGIEAADLERMARDAGATEVAFFGGYQEQPYDRAASVDLLMVARK